MFVKDFCSANHHPVIAKEQTTKSRNNTNEINEVNLSDVVRFGERISKLNNDANYINITTLKEWLDANNYRPYEESKLDIDNTSDINDVITSIQKWLSHIRSEIELFKRNDAIDAFIK